MIKHPALRVRSSADIDPVFHRELADDIEAWGKLTPYAHLIVDFHEVGSYPCERAELHSDLDINVVFASEADRLAAYQLIQSGKKQFIKAIHFLNGLRAKYGILLEPTMQDYNPQLLGKSVYSLREQRHYLADKQRFDIRDGVKAYRVRQRVRPSRYSVKIEDPETGNWREYNPATDTPEMYDQWLSILPQWRRKYGAKLLEFGQTEETRYMKR